MTVNDVGLDTTLSLSLINLNLVSENCSEMPGELSSFSN